MITLQNYTLKIPAYFRVWPKKLSCTVQFDYRSINEVIAKGQLNVVRSESDVFYPKNRERS